MKGIAFAIGENYHPLPLAGQDEGENSVLYIDEGIIGQDE